MKLFSEIATTLQKRKAETIIALGGILLTLLVAVIWWGWLYGIAARTGAVIPRRVLGAAIIVLIILLATCVTFAVHYARELRTVHALNIKLKDTLDNPPRTFRFGVYWDNDGVPYCIDHNLPLSQTIYLNLYHNRCFLCSGGHVVPLTDENGRVLSPTEARERIQSPNKETQGILSSSPTSEKLDKTIALLRAFRDGLPTHEMRDSDRSEYHALLLTAQLELKQNLDEFQVPQSAFKSRNIPNTVSYDMNGRPSNSPFTVEYFIPPEVFKRKIGGLLRYLDPSPDANPETQSK